MSFELFVILLLLMLIVKCFRYCYREITWWKKQGQENTPHVVQVTQEHLPVQISLRNGEQCSTQNVPVSTTVRVNRTVESYANLFENTTSPPPSIMFPVTQPPLLPTNAFDGQNDLPPEYEPPPDYHLCV